jgi:hypothetical protein
MGRHVGPTAGPDVEEKKKVLLLPGIETNILGRQTRSLETIPTELFRKDLKRKIGYNSKSNR